MSRTHHKINRWASEKEYYEARARRKDAPDPELRYELHPPFIIEPDDTCLDLDCHCHVAPPVYRYEAGYQDNHEECLEFWQDTCNCEICGRYLPVGGNKIVYSPMAEQLVSTERMPIAHVNHEGRACHGGQERADAGYLVFDVYDIRGKGI